MTLNGILKQIVNLSYEELLSQAKKAKDKIFPYCKALDKNSDGSVLFATIVIVCVAVDGKLTTLETKFVGDLIGFSEKNILDVIKALPDSATDMVDQIADALDTEAKASFCTLVATVLACDERVVPVENWFLRKIIQ